MKITREQLQALQEQEKTRTRQSKQAGVFGDMFAKELQTGKEQGAQPLEALAAQAAGTVLPPLVNAAAGPDVSTEEQEAATRVNDMCDTLEQYAGQMARDAKADLRAAHGLLENVSGQIAAFKERFGGAANPQVAGILNEIEVIATTERFKFNRGDYL